MHKEYSVKPEVYDAWYYSARSRWMAQQEFSSIMKLFTPVNGQTLLDVGSGTGYFSRRFSEAGLTVTGYDASIEMNNYASTNNPDIKFIQGDATDLPFEDNQFDYCAAITSLCFVENPQQALAEMWRVSRKTVILGLLNRHSLLYYMKRNSKGYQGARWDTLSQVRKWSDNLLPAADLNFRSVIWIPGAGKLSQTIERVAPQAYPFAGFLALALMKQQD